MCDYIQVELVSTAALAVVVIMIAVEKVTVAITVKSIILLTTWAQIQYEDDIFVV